MSKAPPPPVPTVVFGDLDADVWGVVLEGDHAMISVSSLSGAEPSFQPADLQRDDNDGLTVTAPGVALRVETAEQPTTATEPAGRLGLVRVKGAVTVEGSERELELGGLALDSLAPEDRGSVRLFASWFPGERALGLVASRSDDTKGHDRDEIEVAGTGEDQPVVVDPRLSTTYDEHQAPVRVGIELWLADSLDAEENRSRRIAGLATGSRVSVSGPLVQLSAHALRCVSRAEIGAGVYLIVRPAVT